jgi:hypothetical protein
VKAFADFIAETYPAKGWWYEIITHAKSRRHRARGRKPRH